MCAGQQVLLPVASSPRSQKWMLLLSPACSTFCWMPLQQSLRRLGSLCSSCCSECVRVCVSLRHRGCLCCCMCCFPGRFFYQMCLHEETSGLSNCVASESVKASCIHGLRASAKTFHSQRMMHVSAAARSLPLLPACRSTLAFFHVPWDVLAAAAHAALSALRARRLTTLLPDTPEKPSQWKLTPLGRAVVASALDPGTGKKLSQLLQTPFLNCCKPPFSAHLRALTSCIPTDSVINGLLSAAWPQHCACML